MRCGEDAEGCAHQHALRKLGPSRVTRTRRIGGHDVAYQWAVRCVVCHLDGKMTLTAQGQWLLAYCHACKASQPALKTALALLLPDCYSGRSSRGQRVKIEPATLTELALSGMPPMSMKLAMLEMAGWGTPEALDKLGVRRENRSRVINGRINSDAKPQVACRINSDDPPSAA